MQLELSNVKAGRLTEPAKWVKGKRVEFDWRQDFLSTFEFSSIPEDADIFHRNYIEYLEKCWGDHVGIVIKPDILWHILMCEIASLIADNPEMYSDLFTEQDEKQELIIQSLGFVMPLDTLTSLLEPLVPTDMSLFVPEFSTLNDRSRHALLSVFCDTCSPYYNYSMYLCGFPAIDVRGELSDWELTLEAWKKLSETLAFPRDWFTSVEKTLRECCDRLSDPVWWQKMFAIEKCGSGSQIEVSGWLPDLFRRQPNIKFPGNFSTCVSIVDYKHLDLQKDFRMKDGLFFSHYNGDFAIPEFGYTVKEQ